MLDFQGVLFVVAFLSSALAILAYRNYRSIPVLTLQPTSSPLPSLSIIVPARNEARNLRRLLPSLTDLKYPGEVEIIVVDDNSSDGTAQVAESFEVKVLCLDHLPPGWLGKPYACYRGAQAASGDWLLFTDADTIHTLEGVASAVTHATQKDLDGLSLVITINSDQLLIQSALTAAFAGLFAAKLNGSKLINGQYLLISRDSYDTSGGFASVSGEPLEDLAMGRVLRRNQLSVPILRGESAAQVWMYTSYRNLWSGLARIGAGSLKWLGAPGWLSVLLIATAVTPLWGVVGIVSGFMAYEWALLLWMIGISGYIPWAGRFGLRWQAILIPFGALIVLLSSVWGLVRSLGGFGLVWKGRAVKSQPRGDGG